MQQNQYIDKYLKILKDIILSQINREQVMVFVFGSRVLNRYSSSADVDIGLLSSEKLPSSIYHRIKNAVDESIIPWDVDIIDFARVDSSFKTQAMENIIVWNKVQDMKETVAKIET